MAQRNENNIIRMQEKNNTTTAVQEGLVAQINQLQENMNKITKDHEQNESAREDQSQHAEPSSDQLQGEIYKDCQNIIATRSIFEIMWSQAIVPLIHYIC